MVSDCFKHISGNGNTMVYVTVIACRTVRDRENLDKKIASDSPR